MVDWYVPEAVTQRDANDDCQFSNCWAAVGVWLVDASNGGTDRPRIKAFKAKVGETEGGVNPETGCPKGLEVDLLTGLGKFDVARVSRPSLSRDDVEELVGTERRRVFAIAVDYHAWPPDQDCSPAVMGVGVNHMVGLLPGTVEGDKIRVMNPMCVDGQGKPRYQRVALKAVLDAAERFSETHHRDELLLVGVRRPTPAGLEGDQLELETLQETVADQRMALRRARRIITRALG